jgi:cytoskeletal protein RodZ
MPPSATMPAPAAPPPAPAVSGGSLVLPDGPISGEFIKELRVTRGLSLDEVADATKIRKPYLKAVEDEDLTGLPARVYLRGFLTQVARVLKVDRVRLAEGYLQFVEQKGGAPKE